MLKIDSDRNGDFIISLSGMRRRFKAKTLEEVNQAVIHYFRIGHESHNSKKCPLCRED